MPPDMPRLTLIIHAVLDLWLLQGRDNSPSRWNWGLEGTSNRWTEGTLISGLFRYRGRTATHVRNSSQLLTSSSPSHMSGTQSLGCLLCQFLGETHMTIWEVMAGSKHFLGNRSLEPILSPKSNLWPQMH